MTLLGTLGITTDGTSILYTPKAVILVLVYEYLPYMVLCLYTSLESIGDNLVQASRVLVTGSFAESALVGGPNGMMVGSLINSQYNTVLNMGYGATLSCVFLIILSIIMAVVRMLVNLAERRIGGETE